MMIAAHPASAPVVALDCTGELELTDSAQHNMDPVSAMKPGADHPGPHEAEPITPKYDETSPTIKFFGCSSVAVSPEAAAVPVPVPETVAEGPLAPHPGTCTRMT